MLMNETHDIVNDGVHDSKASFTITTFQTIEKALMYIQVNIPQDEQDEKYRKMVLKTRIDMKKMIDGVNSNFVTRMLMENWMKTIDTELKYPLKPVRNISIKCLIDNVF
jgi:fructose-bisphosphate aldolase class 1